MWTMKTIAYPHVVFNGYVLDNYLAEVKYVECRQCKDPVVKTIGLAYF